MKTQRENIELKGGKLKMEELAEGLCVYRIAEGKIVGIVGENPEKKHFYLDMDCNSYRNPNFPKGKLMETEALDIVPCLDKILESNPKIIVAASKNLLDVPTLGLKSKVWTGFDFSLNYQAMARRYSHDDIRKYDSMDDEALMTILNRLNDSGVSLLWMPTPYKTRIKNEKFGNIRIPSFDKGQLEGLKESGKLSRLVEGIKNEDSEAAREIMALNVPMNLSCFL